MTNIQQLIAYDKEILLALNGSESLFWDNFMRIFTGTIIWIPLAVVLLYVIIRNYSWKETLLIVGMLGLAILLADRISSGFFKPYFQRFRPTQDPEIMYLVDIVNGYRGGRFGFISSHAANSFGIVTFIALLLKKRNLTFALLIWALLNCYSRIYLGVHYLGDILCGILCGVLCGLLVYLLYRYLDNRLFRRNNHRSVRYASCGQTVADSSVILTTLFFSYFVLIVISLWI